MFCQEKINNKQWGGVKATPKTKGNKMKKEKMIELLKTDLAYNFNLYTHDRAKYHQIIEKMSNQALKNEIEYLNKNKEGK